MCFRAPRNRFTGTCPVPNGTSSPHSLPGLDDAVPSFTCTCRTCRPSVVSAWIEVDEDVGRLDVFEELQQRRRRLLPRLHPQLDPVLRECRRDLAHPGKDG